jgi:hypothetical protein
MKIDVRITRDRQPRGNRVRTMMEAMERHHEEGIHRQNFYKRNEGDVYRLIGQKSVNALTEEIEKLLTKKNTLLEAIAKDLQATHMARTNNNQMISQGQQTQTMNPNPLGTTVNRLTRPPTVRQILNINNTQPAWYMNYEEYCKLFQNCDSRSKEMIQSYEMYKMMNQPQNTGGPNTQIIPNPGKIRNTQQIGRTHFAHPANSQINTQNQPLPPINNFLRQQTPANQNTPNMINTTMRQQAPALMNQPAQTSLTAHHPRIPPIVIRPITDMDIIRRQQRRDAANEYLKKQDNLQRRTTLGMENKEGGIRTNTITTPAEENNTETNTGNSKYINKDIEDTVLYLHEQRRKKQENETAKHETEKKRTNEDRGNDDDCDMTELITTGLSIKQEERYAAENKEQELIGGKRASPTRTRQVWKKNKINNTPITIVEEIDISKEIAPPSISEEDAKTEQESTKEAIDNVEKFVDEMEINTEIEGRADKCTKTLTGKSEPCLCNECKTRRESQSEIRKGKQVLNETRIKQLRGLIQEQKSKRLQKKADEVHITIENTARETTEGKERPTKKEHEMMKDGFVLLKTIKTEKQEKNRIIGTVTVEKNNEIEISLIDY